MADEKQSAVETQGAAPDQVSPHYQETGNPLPPETPATKPKEEAAADENDEQKKPAEDGEEDNPPSNEQTTEDDPEDEASDELDVETWGDTGTEVGNDVLMVLQNSGVSTEDAKALLYDAMVEGKPENIDRDALVEKVGKANANLIMIGVKEYIREGKDKAEAINTTVHDAAGGKDNWEKVTTWARETLPEETLNEYRGMIEHGGMQAEMAAKDLLGKFNAADTNTTINNTDEVAGDNLKVDGARELTAREYHKEMKAANDRFATPAEIQEIKDARARGRAKGK